MFVYFVYGSCVYFVLLACVLCMVQVSFFCISNTFCVNLLCVVSASVVRVFCAICIWFAFHICFVIFHYLFNGFVVCCSTFVLCVLSVCDFAYGSTSCSVATNLLVTLALLPRATAHPYDDSDCRHHVPHAGAYCLRSVCRHHFPHEGAYCICSSSSAEL